MQRPVRNRSKLSDAIGPVVGIDLAGSPRRTTGFCVLTGKWEVRTQALTSDADVIRETLAVRPHLVIVDAPLSLPRGRPSLETAGPPHFRLCDLELRKMGIRFFPLTLGPMRMLTARGMKLKSVLESHGLRVVESYPGGSQDLLGIPRKSVGSEQLGRALVRLGLRGDIERRGLSHDELDAVTIAWVGRMHLLGMSQTLGDPDEGVMVLPLSRSRPKPRGASRA